jgi:hypothetical protein
MVPSITTILHRFTGEWGALLQPEAILVVCGEIGDPGWHDRVLTPVTTVQLFLLPMDVWHSQTVPGVLKELTIFAIVYHLVRLVMWHSAMRHHLAVERISFLETLRWLGAPSPGIP